MFLWNALAFSMIWPDVVKLISGSSAFYKSSLNIWNFSVHILLKPGLENFEHYFTSMWDERNCAVVWAFLASPFFGIGMKTDLFQSCGHCWIFQICWPIECNTLTAPSFRIWNSSAIYFEYIELKDVVKINFIFINVLKSVATGI